MAQKLYTCRCCHIKDINKETMVEFEDWIMPKKGVYYHMKCYQEKPSIEANNKSNDYWLDKIWAYLKIDARIPNLDYSKIKRQFFLYIKNGEYTAKGIYFSLVYLYDYKKANKEKAEGGIGIVPYVYKEAGDFWAEKYQKDNTILEAVARQIEERQERIKLKIKKKKKVDKKSRFNFNDIGEEEC